MEILVFKIVPIRMLCIGKITLHGLREAVSHKSCPVLWFSCLVTC